VDHEKLELWTFREIWMVKQSLADLIDDLEVMLFWNISNRSVINSGITDRLIDKA